MGIKRQLFRCLAIFLENATLFRISFMMVEGNIGQDLRVVPYLEKILIQGLTDIKYLK